MNNQYELELDTIDVNDWYVDQSPNGGMVVCSVYTSYGIQKIDEQFCKLIQNIHNKIKKVYVINRRVSTYSDIKTREVHEGYLDYHTWYDPIPKSELNRWNSEIRIEWENGLYHDFYYGDRPIFNLETGNIDPERLKKQIKGCPNLHVMIKENLLGNLENYLK